MPSFVEAVPELDGPYGPGYPALEMVALPEDLPLRAFRLEACYSASRLKILDETRHLARDFEEAADKLAMLEAEEGELSVRRMQTQAHIETADDAWDDTMRAFRARLLEMVEQDTDRELYRRYFADIPSHVTSLSYAAEVLISKDLEALLAHDEDESLAAFEERLRNKRETLEGLMLERTQLEVEEARFQNRSAMAKHIVNRLRRVLAANLQEIQLNRGREDAWRMRFFFAPNALLERSEREGAEVIAASASGDEESVMLLPSEAPTA